MKSEFHTQMDCSQCQMILAVMATTLTGSLTIVALAFKKISSQSEQLTKIASLQARLNEKLVKELTGIEDTQPRN